MLNLGYTKCFYYQEVEHQPNQWNLKLLLQSVESEAVFVEVAAAT